MLRRCSPGDFEAIHAVINDAAQAYRGVIARDCFKEPYMAHEELRAEIASGVDFWGIEEGGQLSSVMGLQNLAGVSLIRHAYTRTLRQGKGLGTALLAHLRTRTDSPMLVGTWKAAEWALAFYQRRGFRLVPDAEKPRLLRRYWTVPERQIEESVVLAEERWFANPGKISA